MIKGNLLIVKRFQSQKLSSFGPNFDGLGDK